MRILRPFFIFLSEAFAFIYMKKESPDNLKFDSWARSGPDLILQVLGPEICYFVVLFKGQILQSMSEFMLESKILQGPLKILNAF